MSLHEKLPPRSDEEAAQLRNGRILGLADYVLAQLRFAEVRRLSTEASATMLAEDIQEIVNRFRFWEVPAQPEISYDLSQLIVDLAPINNDLQNRDNPFITGGPFILDIDGGELETPYIVPGQRKVVTLDPLQRDLAHFFFLNPNRIFSHDKIGEYVWRGVVSNTGLKSQMHLLRKKVGDPKVNGKFRHFESKLGYGFRFVP